MSDQNSISNIAFPLLAISPNGNRRFIGTAIVLEAVDQVVLTCAHVISDAENDDRLFLCVYGTDIMHQLDTFFSDKSMDISFSRLQEPKKISTKFSLREVLDNRVKVILADDIMAFGFISPNPNHPPIEIRPQIRKGYVAWQTDSPTIEPGCRTVNVSSYAVPKGFSGGPVMFHGKPASLAGMSFGNLKSEVCIYEKSEVLDNGHEYKEKTSQIIETGTFHSTSDIQHFLNNHL